MFIHRGPLQEVTKNQTKCVFYDVSETQRSAASAKVTPDCTFTDASFCRVSLVEDIFHLVSVAF